MIPEVGMELTYLDAKRVLRVRIIEYKLLSGKELFTLESLENKCGYKEGQYFPKERNFGDESVWNLLD